jgi:lipopolysaccharide transport system ATP-binding protein
MALPIIEVSGLSKRYQLGDFGFSSFREEAEKWLRRLRKTPGTELNSADSKSDEFWALRDVSFNVQPGEVVGIIGRNGAGKSTLLKLLSRITEPTSGEIVLRGRVASLLEVGTGFHPELSGRENIFLNGAILGMKRAEISAKFDEIVAFAEVEQFIDTPVKRYSSGMYVRLAFAVAAHLEPEILIVDEVLAVGDVQFQKKCMGKMQDVARKSGRTVLFVSHNMDAIARLCPRCILLSGGQVAYAGETTHAVDIYQNGASSGRDTQMETWTPLPSPGGGESPASFTRFRLRNLTKPTAVTVRTGERLAIDLEVECSQPLAVSNLAVMLSTAAGVRLINADTGKLGQQLSLRKGLQQFTVQLEQLPLSVGDYCLNFYLANTRSRQVFHSVTEQHLLRISPSVRIGPVDIPEVDGLLDVPFSVEPMSS